MIFTRLCNLLVSSCQGLLYIYGFILIIPPPEKASAMLETFLWGIYFLFSLNMFPNQLFVVGCCDLKITSERSTRTECLQQKPTIQPSGLLKLWVPNPVLPPHLTTSHLFILAWLQPNDRAPFLWICSKWISFKPISTNFKYFIRVKVRLPDHDFAVGSRHLLTPSVAAVLRMDERGFVSFSGETYIGIRSQKHNNSSAFTHHEDLLKMVSLFPDAFKNAEGVVKPVIIKGIHAAS